MRKAWGWIDLQEEHLRTRLQEEDPLFNSMATSAPSGDARNRPGFRTSC
jgi:hypothetical protein